MHETEEDDAEGPLNVERLCAVFREQLIACLEECARGRAGLFSAPMTGERVWPEAEQLRALAVALQAMMTQLRLEAAGGRLIEQFLDLCAMHGDAHPGEARLARQFLGQLQSEEAKR
jgi:hypothetical protein